MHFFVLGWKKEPCDKAREDFNFYFRKVLVEEIEVEKKGILFCSPSWLLSLFVSLLLGYKSLKAEKKETTSSRKVLITRMLLFKDVRILCSSSWILGWYIYHPNSGKNLRNLLCVIYASLCVNFSVKIIPRQDIKLGKIRNKIMDFVWAKKTVQCHDA